MQLAGVPFVIIAQGHSLLLFSVVVPFCSFVSEGN